MSDALLDYSSWSFQLITLLAVLYLILGLINPAWVWASKRSTIVVVSVIVLLLASTAFYVAVRPLPGALDSPVAIEAEPPPVPAQP
jgi:surface polysaccharide O-acyltransferase-like enzyme